jgi:DegV family protein with EDD domain
MCALRIVIDAGFEVPADLVARHRLKVVPLVVRFGDEVHDDGTLSLEEYWTKALTVAHPQTSQPSSGAFEKVFRELVEAGDDILCITITSKHSGTFNSAWVAAQQFPGKVTLFDSLYVSWGSAWLALKAAEMVEAGEPVSAILPRLEAIRSNIQLPILLNTIEYVRKGGRANRLIPMLEKVLRAFSIKPILSFVDGELKIVGTARSYERGIARLLDLMADRAPYQKLAVLHTRQPEIAEAFADRLAERVSFPREQVYIAEVGPVLASHAGPKVLACSGVPEGI